MSEFNYPRRVVFSTVALSTLIQSAVQVVPEGTWLELKPEPNSKLKLCLYKLSPEYKGEEELALSVCEKYDLTNGQLFLLNPAQFFLLEGKGEGRGEFSTIPNLYFNKKFNSMNGLGQPHSEISYFKACYVDMHPEFGLRPLQVLDLGCGRGRNAVIFAGDVRQEYRVLGLDRNVESLSSWNQMAEIENLQGNGKLLGRQVDLNVWREAPVHDIAIAIVSLQFLEAIAAVELLRHCMERAERGALHLAVFPIASSHPEVVWPNSFDFLPQSDEVKYLYMQHNWSILEYRENYGHLGKIAENNLPVRGLFATLIAQKI